MQAQALALSLASMLPQEVEWALNVLGLAASRPEPEVRLDALPGVLQSLLQLIKDGLEEDDPKCQSGLLEDKEWEAEEEAERWARPPRKRLRRRPPGTPEVRSGKLHPTILEVASLHLLRAVPIGMAIRGDVGHQPVRCRTPCDVHGQERFESCGAPESAGYGMAVADIKSCIQGWWWEAEGLFSDSDEDCHRFTWLVCATALLRNLALVPTNQAVLAQPACLECLVRALISRDSVEPLMVCMQRIPCRVGASALRKELLDGKSMATEE